MAYKVQMLADSLGPSGCRLTTIEATYPRMVHPEALTHRQVSRNSASSRAIPSTRMLSMIESDPVLPVYWGANERGMVASLELPPDVIERAKAVWLEGRDHAVDCARKLSELGVHKQLCNRPTEPFMWITVVFSATEWGNFFALRIADDAQPEIQALARRMAVLYYRHQPQEVPAGYWHLPYILPGERDTIPIPDLKRIAAARVARLSYLTHTGIKDAAEDYRLHDQLRADGHWSPFEHCAAAVPDPVWHGNFRGWLQYRKEFPEEECRTFTPTEAQLLEWEADYPDVLRAAA